MNYVKSLLLLLASALLSYAESAATESAPAAAGNAAAGNAAAQANNPLANMKALNFQNYYIGELTESSEDANQFLVRYAQPVRFLEYDWLVRATLPVNTYPIKSDGGHDTGIGDFNIFAAALIETDDPAVSFGFGPQLTLPTASEDLLGSEQWSAGFANVYFNARSPRLQYGYLLTWQASFAGEDDRDDVNLGAWQPFVFYQLGGGHYLRSTGVWAYNLENDDYTIPLGLGYGRAIKKGNTVFNLFIEPQISVADEGAGWADWQVYVGFNMQFLGGK